MSPNLIPVTQWEKHHAYPTERALRHFIFDSKTNGFDKVIRRIGGRILIHEGEFFKWVEEQNEKKGG